MIDRIAALGRSGLDMLEAMHKKGAHEDFLDEILPRLEHAHTAEAALAQDTLEKVLKHLVSLDPDEAQWYSKDALRTLADVAQLDGFF